MLFLLFRRSDFCDTIPPHHYYTRNNIKGYRFVSIMSQLRLLILTVSKSKSWQSRKSEQFQHLCLGSWDISISIEISWFSLDINWTKKSQLRSRFIEIYQNSQFFIYLYWDNYFSSILNVEICGSWWGKPKVSLEKSRKNLKSKISW